jgi:hypothetical protein
MASWMHFSVQRSTHHNTCISVAVRVALLTSCSLRIDNRDAAVCSCSCVCMY